MLKGIVVEDNLYIRKKLEQVITSIGGIEIKYCVDSGEELLDIYKHEDFDIVFLDIGLPGISGIETARILRTDYPETDIIFITSHEEYIKDAVELYAADYINKPLDVARLKRTLERVKRKYQESEKVLQFRSGYKTKLIKENDIYLVEAFLDKAKIYSSNRIFEVNNSLKELETLLDMEMFIRTSRSYLVNVQKVSSIKPCTRTSFEVHFLGNDYIAYLSKSRYQDFRYRVKEFNETDIGGEG